MLNCGKLLLEPPLVDPIINNYHSYIDLLFYYLETI